MSWTPNAAPIPWQSEIYSANPRRPLGSAQRAWGRALTVLLAACAGFSVLTVMLDLYGIALFNNWEADPSNIVVPDGVHFDSMTSVLVVLQLFVLIATGIATMTWLYQAYGSREADPALLPFKRWWTIGSWLIPVVCLVRPFELMRDLHRATASASQERPDTSVKCPQLFRWWWACWILGNILSYLATRASLVDDPDFGQMRTALSLELSAR